MPVNPAFWRSLLADFEKLQTHRFSLILDLIPLKRDGESLEDSHYVWTNFPDPSLKARLSALALRGARALGYGSEYDWYDQLLTSGFVRFDVTGSLGAKLVDGVMVESEWGRIFDVVKESITLCYKLETDAGLPNRPGPAPPSQGEASPTGKPDSEAGPVGTDSTAELQAGDPARLSGPEKRGANRAEQSQMLAANEDKREPSGGEKTGPKLKVEFIKDWMEGEGWTNQSLAQRLKISERAVSSMRNNGEYHGSKAVTKLANLMGRDIDDLYRL